MPKSLDSIPSRREKGGCRGRRGKKRRGRAVNERREIRKGKGGYEKREEIIENVLKWENIYFQSSTALMKFHFLSYMIFINLFMFLYMLDTFHSN